MARKPAKMYRQIKGQSFTRREYTGGVPNNRILRYHMGNRKRAETGGFPVTLELTADNACQIRDSALESARQVANSTIREDAGAMGYGQFISSSYRAYAIDFDGDNSVDLFNSVDDAIGSIANYLKVHGWKKNGKINSVNDFSFKGRIKGKIGTFSFEEKKIIQNLNIYKTENKKFTKF